ncbi:MAG: hypothetical protein V7609_2093 [Verrucomicrobiota bacterium]
MKKLLPHEAVSRLQIAAAIGVMNFRSAFVNVNTLINTRSLQDANLKVTRTLPAAGAANTSAALDLDIVGAGRVPGVELVIDLPATPSLVDAKTIILTVEDSADNSSFATVAAIPSITVTGAGGVGAAAVQTQLKLPIALRRYVRLAAATLAAGGDNTAITASLYFVF